MDSKWSNLVARRDLLQELVVSELRTSTAGTRLGWIWWLLDPLLLMLIYWAIISGLLGRGRVEYAPYPIFILCALITWKHLSVCAATASHVLRSREALIKSVPFPTMVLPLSLVLSSLVYFLFGFLVLLIAAALWPSPHHSGNLLALVQAPLLIVLQTLIIIGICLPLASFGALVRDLGNVMRYVLRVGFYVSPGLFGIDLVRDVLHDRLEPTLAGIAYFVYLLNPFAVLISGYRDCIFYGEFVPLGFWLILFVEAAGLLLVGHLIYHHYDRRVIKFL
jgi:ABC-type polysaccharide/polyol phosphate export permease